MAILVCCIFAGTVDKSKVEILQNFVAFSEYTNFKIFIVVILITALTVFTQKKSG